MAILDFEKPIFELEARINELKEFGDKDGSVSLAPEIARLQSKLAKMKKDIYENLSVWQRVQISRHPDRPYTYDYIHLLATDFIELHGDRQFADDLAIVGGLGKIDGKKVMFLGHQKGRDTSEKIKRNFGCAHPEGYKKAIRLMKVAEKFNIPIVVFIDTPGAYPGLGAEERGQAQAIAENLQKMADIKTPIIATVIGEGGSGGALGIGVADKVMILQHAYYSVISPEGCASILWRNAVKAPDAAKALKINGEDLIKFGIVDKIIPEPLGGAHQDPAAVVADIKKAVLEYIDELSVLSHEDLIERRYNRFRKIGKFSTKS